MSSATPLPDISSIPAVGKCHVLLFWAPWHEASTEGGRMHAVLLALASQFQNSIVFGRVAAEDCPDVSSHYGVTVVPTVVLVNAQGTVTERVEGEDRVAELTQAVQRLATANPESVVPPKKQEEDDLSARLDRLINSSDVMLFMKGVPTAPKCGFSRQAVEMLESESIPFGSFDILQNEEVRQGLKKHSNWPTYPQLYVKGELIGGLDIMKELKDEEGGLKQQLGLTDITTPPVADQSLDDRLKALVNRHRVMLFMKGLPSQPRCGFSRQMCEMLDEQHISYDAFDILQDEEVRQGLKKYSDWPTYPQLYVDGELIGGLDICKELIETGDLTAMLQEQ
jgi:Grx4 family monothiol glutaredoxin